MITSDRYCWNCGAANTEDGQVCFACGESMKRTRPLPSPAASLEHLLHQRYRILEQVGSGGFSAVYKAEDTSYNNQRVAIKAVSFKGMKATEVIEATEAYNREVQLLTGLQHPNLPRIYDHFSDTQCWYMVMDFIEGVTLERHLEKMAITGTQFSLEEVLDIGILLCNVLEYLHSRQPVIVFRDLKPANVILTLNGHLALIDFGIARHFKPGQARDTLPFGSPGYAAPEQYGKAQTTPCTDIYSLGAMLHQLLTGNDPSQTPFRFAPLHMQGDPSLTKLETLIMRMVEMDAGRRPEIITVVRQQLQEIAGECIISRGLPAATGTLVHASPPMASSHTFVPFPQIQNGGTITVGTQGQMILVTQPTPGPGFGTSSGYSSQVPPGSGRTIPQTQTNGYAIASMLLGFAGFIMPLFLCAYLTAPAGRHHFHHFTLQTPSPLQMALFLIAPSLLAILFGYIGRHRARTMPGMQGSQNIASTGLTFGYFFAILYTIVILFLSFVLPLLLSLRSMM